MTASEDRKKTAGISLPLRKGKHMAFLDKLNAITKNVGDKTNDMIETTKLNAKIAKEKAVIEEKKHQLGRLYWEKYAAGTVLDEDAAAICGEIQSAYDAIAGFEAEIAAIKKEKEGEKKEEPPTAPAAAEITSGGAFCPLCGSANAPGAVSCQSCGASLKPVVRICANCGAELAQGDAFCSECGTKA